MIIGFVGKIASGKSEAARYIKKEYGFGTCKFSSVLREVLDSLYLDQTRENLTKLSESLRGKFGGDILSKVVAERVKEQENVVVEGIRRKEDIKYLKDNPNFVLASISTDEKIRYNRIKDRKENEDDFNKSFEEFKQDQKLSTEVTIPEVIDIADEEIKNNDSLEVFHKKLDKLIRKYEN